MFLKGKSAIITGSTSGIGLAYARALAGEGASPDATDEDGDGRLSGEGLGHAMDGIDVKLSGSVTATLKN